MNYDRKCKSIVSDSLCFLCSIYDLQIYRALLRSVYRGHPPFGCFPPASRGVNNERVDPMIFEIRLQGRFLEYVVTVSRAPAVGLPARSHRLFEILQLRRRGSEERSSRNNVQPFRENSVAENNSLRRSFAPLDYLEVNRCFLLYTPGSLVAEAKIKFS